MTSRIRHFASPGFWSAYEALPATIKKQADRKFALLKDNPRHPSLHLKKVGAYWSVRVSAGWRAIGMDVEEGILWFWIGSHTDYDKLLK